MITFPLILTVFLFGGIYSFSVFFAGAFLSVLYFIRLNKSKKSIIVKNHLYYGTLCLCFSAVCSMIFALDKGMAFLGVLRVFVCFVWMLYLMQLSEKERDFLLSIVPDIGSVMTVLGILSYPIPMLRVFLWQAGRFGGFFQYSNSCALFFILGIFILILNSKTDRKNLFKITLLIAGVFLTGSRGGMIILICFLLWVVITKKQYRKLLITELAVLLSTGFVYGYVSGNFQNIARIFTVFRLPGTLYGRILYMIDAVPVILKHPLGIGYMSYAVIQPSIQTGVYTSKFVHNDWLQFTLDYGLPFVLILIIIVLIQLVKGKQEKWKKILLVLILSYSLLEFHLQYFSIIMILPLLFDFQDDKAIIQRRGVVLENQIIVTFASVVFLYFGIAGVLSYAGMEEASLSMYPYDTQTITSLLEKETEKEQAENLAKRLCKLNPYESLSYNVLCYSSLMDGNIKDAISYKLKVLEIERFQMEHYSDFEQMIKMIQQQYHDDGLLMEFCEDSLETMYLLLEDTQKNVSPIAYMIRDIPVFSW